MSATAVIVCVVAGGPSTVAAIFSWLLVSDGCVSFIVSSSSLFVDTGSFPVVLGSPPLQGLFVGRRYTGHSPRLCRIVLFPPCMLLAVAECPSAFLVQVAEV